MKYIQYYYIPILMTITYLKVRMSETFDSKKNIKKI